MFKRAFDLIVSIMVFILISPFFLILMLLVGIKIGSPVFFVQKRPGKYGNPFKMYKFRSMTNEKDEEGNLLSDGSRLTNFGKFIRRTSLDELPELINVIKGDMSLVGPRPLLMEYLTLYNQQQIKRHDVRPGITGWAQVNGRNNLDWEEKFDLDVWYVEHRSFLLDLRIIMLTFIKVFKKEGISAEGEDTMPKFEG